MPCVCVCVPVCFGHPEREHGFDQAPHVLVVVSLHLGALLLATLTLTAPQTRPRTEVELTLNRHDAVSFWVALVFVDPGIVFGVGGHSLSAELNGLKDNPDVA